MEKIIYKENVIGSNIKLDQLKAIKGILRACYEDLLH